MGSRRKGFTGLRAHTTSILKEVAVKELAVSPFGDFNRILGAPCDLATPEDRFCARGYEDPTRLCPGHVAPTELPTAIVDHRDAMETAVFDRAVAQGRIRHRFDNYAPIEVALETASIKGPKAQIEASKRFSMVSGQGSRDRPSASPSPPAAPPCSGVKFVPPLATK